MDQAGAIVVNKLHDAIERQGGIMFVSNRFALGQTGNKFFGGIWITEILTNFSLGGKFLFLNYKTGRELLVPTRI